MTRIPAPVTIGISAVAAAIVAWTMVRTPARSIEVVDGPPMAPAGHAAPAEAVEDRAIDEEAVDAGDVVPVVGLPDFVAGRVTDFEGAPVPNAVIAIDAWKSSLRYESVIADAHGRFQFAAEPGRLYHLRGARDATGREGMNHPLEVRAGEQDARVVLAVPSAAAPTPLAPRAGFDARMSLSAPARKRNVRGLVLDPSGRPVPGARVSVTRSFSRDGIVGGAFFRSGYTTTSADGAFVFDLPFDRPNEGAARVTVYLEDSVRSWSAPVRAEDHEMVVHVDPGLDATLRLPPGDAADWALIGYLEDGEHRNTRVSISHGVAKLRGLVHGDRLVAWVQAGDSGDAAFERGIEPGSAVALRRTEGGVIEGRVIADETAVVAIWAYETTWGFPTSAKPASDGRFSFRGLPVGTRWNVRAWDENHRDDPEATVKDVPISSRIELDVRSRR